MHYDYNMILTFVSNLFSGITAGNHAARVKATAVLLQGLLFLKQASLSGMGRGAAILKGKSFISQLKRAYRLMKNGEWDAWEVGAALYGYMTEHLSEVEIVVDWTQIGRFMVLQASLIVGGRGIPFYGIAVLADEIKGRQTTIELSMWYALEAMRLEGQTMYVIVDRGFAKMDWIGASELYPYMHRIIRLKSQMILKWDTVEGALSQWPLYPGEVVTIENATLGRKKQVVSGVCLANVSPDEETLIYLACSPEDVAVVLKLYKKRPWIEQQIRDMKTNFLVRLLRLFRADRLERMLSFLGLAFYMSYCNQTAQASEFAKRMGRRYKDGRKDLSWLSLAKYAELSGQCSVVLCPITAQ